MRKLFPHCLTLLLAVTLQEVARAQAPSMGRDLPHAVWIEIEKPQFDELDTGILNGLLVPSFRGAVSERTFIVLDLPISHADLGDGSGQETMFGNPYVGVEYGAASSPVWWEAGIRPPIASEDNFSAALIGLQTDFNRAEAFLPDLLSIVTRFNYRDRMEGGGVFHVRPGLAYLIPDGGTADLLFDYMVMGGYEFADFVAGAELSGRLVVTTSDGGGDPFDRSVNQLTLLGHKRTGSIRPGLELRIPLNNLATDYIVTARVGFAL